MSVANPIQGYSLGTVILGQSNLDTPVVNTTEFSAPFGRPAFSSTEADHKFVVPRGMTLHSLFVNHTNAQAVTVQVVTIKIEGTDTAITVDIPLGVGGFTSDIINRAHINAGEDVALSFASQSGATNALIRAYSFLGDLDG